MAEADQLAVDPSVAPGGGEILTTSMPASASTASYEALNCRARSRTRNRSRVARSPRSITRLRACWIVRRRRVCGYGQDV